jgi:hypothetical protein
MSTFNLSIKQDAGVLLAGGTTATLVVPTDKVFKGQISGLQFNGAGDTLTVRQNNLAGSRLISKKMDALTVDGGANGNAGAFNVTLSAGTYYLYIENAPLNQSVAFTGTLYANTL